MRISDWSSDVCSSDLGLSQSLTSGGESLEGAICNGASGNLSVLYSGGAVPDALEQLSARRFQALIDMCMRDYDITLRSEEHTYELQTLIRKSYAVFCLQKKTHTTTTHMYKAIY